MKSNPTIKKVPAASVPYGEQVTTRGGYVWAAYDPAGKLLCIAAMVGEARRMAKRILQGLPARPRPPVVPYGMRIRHWKDPKPRDG